MKSTVGEGTTFYLYLPILFEEPSPTKQDDQLLAFNREITVLLVEDSPLNLKATEDMLSTLGFQVMTADNGKIA